MGLGMHAGQCVEANTGSALARAPHSCNVGLDYATTCAQVAVKTKKLKTCWKKLQAARTELKQAQVHSQPMLVVVSVSLLVSVSTSESHPTSCVRVTTGGL